MSRRVWLCVASAWICCSAAALAQNDAPSPLSGTWTWQWKDADGMNHRHILEVEGVGPKLAARERFDELPAVKVDDLKLSDKEVRFSVTRDSKRSEYQGNLTKADTINGTVSVAVMGQTSQFGWTALKEKPEDKVSPRPKPKAAAR